MNHTLDAVVVGAGLAGLECARRLGEAGLCTMLVDRKLSVTSGVSTTGVFVRKTIEDFDLPAMHLGPAIHDVALYSPSRRVLKLTSGKEEFRIGRMGPLYVHYLERCRRAGVRILTGARFQGVKRQGKHSVLQLQQDGCTFFVPTRFIVGADGARSRMARHLGLDANHKFIGGCEEVWRGVELAGPPSLRCYLDPNLAPGYLAWVAHDGEETHIGVGGYLHRFNPVLALEQFRESILGEINLRGANLIQKRGGLIPVGGVLPRIANSRGLLVGDAAGAASPLTAGGLDAALRLSNHAARVIVEYLRTEDSRVLEAYSGERFRTRFFSRLWMRRIFAGMRSARALECVFTLLSAPPLREMARHVYFGRGSFPEIEPLPVRQPALDSSR
jgi:flavin-dependent dehydrogenase